MSKLLLITGFIFGLTNTAKADFGINQNFITRLYEKVFTDFHRPKVEGYFSQKLSPYNCTEEKLSYDVLAPYEESWFGVGTPGQIKFNFQASCKDQNLVKFEFAFVPAGFDEDYSEIIVKITTKSNIIQERRCIYATHENIKACPKELEETKDLSKP